MTVTSRVDWRKALEGQQAIVHLAAETGIGQSICCIEYTNKGKLNMNIQFVEIGTGYSNYY